MSLNDLIAADLSVLFSTDDCGASATYTDPSGETTSLTVVPFPEYTDEREQLGMLTRQKRRGCAINRSELASVNQHATITIGDVEYSIASVLSEDDHVTVVELSRRELIEQARPGYRRSQ